MSKTTKLLDRRGNIPAIDLKYTGEEPTWEDVDNLSVDDYYRRRSRALSFYAYYCDSTTLRPFLTKWMGTNGYTKTQVKMIESAPAWSVSSTVGKLVRMLQRGMPDIHPDSSNYFLRYKSDENPNPKPEKASTFIHKELTSALALLKENDEAKPVASVTKAEPIKNPQQRIEERVKETVILELEDYLDRVTSMSRDTTPAKMPTLDLSNLLRAHTIPANGIKPIVDWCERYLNEFKEAYDKGCPQLVQGYSWCTRPQLKRLIENVEKFVEEARTHGRVKISQRKPRIKKPKAADKQISRLKYAKDSSEYNLNSVNPIKIPFSQHLYLFNPKNRQLHIYHAQSHDGFSVKGSSLCGYEPDNSMVYTLRKPNDLLPTILGGNLKKIEKEMSALKSKPKKVNGRFNENLIILKVIENR
jgi:hypothetical protein